MKNTAILLLIVSCALMYLSRGIDAEAARNVAANAYCAGKGYEQGQYIDGLVWCQKISIVQDSFEYPL